MLKTCHDSSKLKFHQIGISFICYFDSSIIIYFVLGKLYRTVPHIHYLATLNLQFHIFGFKFSIFGEASIGGKYKAIFQ